ncbi:leucine-rich repeat and guanylate kinase domain-containing protein isoform X3 [Corvus kubaryi]|uniref:leucine-rich repeat and guanylate kinase domain-containing protein isoform X3 n=1 Tax=Corvus kubaryi TaxID=68294 RepID=UPI001C058B9E|nr:leucine-rich repeat and guanylate kinase domain-containing protein isoform X3 [Corvus kubaryi]
MAGGEENGGEGSLGERLPPSHEPPQPLAQGLPEEQPQLGPPHRKDEQEEDGEEEEESERSEGRLEGVLDEDTAAEGLHTLGYSAPGTEYVYLHLTLPGRELSDISILSGYIHLQKMELSSNKINDLSCISHMPYLMELNASKNELTTYFNFKPPKNLREVDFSHNRIPKMQDLAAYHSLTKLLLDYNEIEEIRGLEKCHSLTQLGLSHNRLTAIRGLENLPIRILSLVAELSELKWIGDLPLLRVLNLLKNPLQEQGEYWLLAIFTLLQITELDLKKVSVEEKVAAVNRWDPPPEVVAAEDHRIHVLSNILQPQRVLDSTLPAADDPYPMLVLLGPLVCGKRELSLKICRQFKNFFRFGPCHTTRTAYFGEENRLDYYFISQEEFDKMVKGGKFLATYKYSGHCYGLGRDTVESIAREGLATCIHLEIEGVRSLKKTYFKPKYILLVPKDKGKYEQHLRRTGLFSRPEIEEAVSRVDMYLQINQDLPGYFDAVINTDELDEAFAELSLLVEVNLGLKPPGIFDSTQDINSRAGSRTKLFPEQKLSPGRRIPAPTWSPSVGDFLEPSAKRYPRDLLDVLNAPPGSMEEASLQRRCSAARQALFHRDLDAESKSSHQQLLKPRPPLSSDPRNQNFHLTMPETRKSKFKKAVKPNMLSSRDAKAEHQEPGGAGKGVDASKGAEAPGENLQRKSSKAKLGSSAEPQLQTQPGSHSKAVLPPIPAGRKSTNS